jgi:hypothetical protein
MMLEDIHIGQLDKRVEAELWIQRGVAKPQAKLCKKANERIHPMNKPDIVASAALQRSLGVVASLVC